ncbi:MAG: hypothetical protein KDG89_16750 [Geminicoccaceae bacterium]|nr:hypothetical protein [Geminicoccaceae bacterium]
MATVIHGRDGRRILPVIAFPALPWPAGAAALLARTQGPFLLLLAPLLLLPGAGGPFDLLCLAAVLAAGLALARLGQGLGLALRRRLDGTPPAALPSMRAAFGLVLALAVPAATLPGLLLAGGLLLLVETLRRSLPQGLGPLGPLLGGAAAMLQLDLLLTATGTGTGGAVRPLGGLIAAVVALGAERGRLARLAKDDPLQRFGARRLVNEGLLGAGTALAMGLYLAAAADLASLTAPPMLLALVRHHQLATRPIGPDLRRPAGPLADPVLACAIVAWAVAAVLVAGKVGG